MRFRYAAVVFLSSVLSNVLPCFLAADEPAKAQQWAVLIGVQRYDDSRLNLDFTGNDAAAVKKVLCQRAAMPEDHVLTMTEESDASRRPTLANIRKELPKLLGQAAPDDRVIIFFSGHGYPVDGETYLLPSDFRLDAAKTTGLPARELREALTGCRAKSKFLVLDCCHAGGAKNAEQTGLDAETVAKAILPKPVEGCLVLASCRASERSREWSQRKQGVFTYWLCRALEGGADKNGDGQVTADEVYQYTYERVSNTVAQVFHDRQNPAIYPVESGFPTVLSLRPEPPESLCRRLAEHLDLEIRRSKLKRIGVLEFLQPIGWTEALAAANLPAYCAAQIREQLGKLSDGDYEVLSEAATKDATKGVRIESLGDPQRMQPLRRDQHIDALVTGVLRRRGRNMNVQCDLVSTADGNSMVTPSGVLPLSEDLIGDTGASFTNANRPNGGPYDAQVVNHVQSAQDHPLLLTGDDAFPFRIELWSIDAKPGEEVTADTPRTRKDFVLLRSQSKGAEVEGKSKRTELIVAAKEGELFEIRIETRSRNRAAMSLLVDGLNTLGQKRERLGSAWSWVLEPSSEPGQPRKYTIDGWHLPKAESAEAGQAADFTVKRFQFVDIAQSVAGRHNFNDSIGLITAAFYAEKGRALGVGEGPEEQRNLKCAGFQPGRLLGVINIRYVDQRELDRMLQNR